MLVSQNYSSVIVNFSKLIANKSHFERKESEFRKKFIESVEIRGLVESLDFQKIIEKGMFLTNVTILFAEPLNVNNIFLRHKKRPSGSVIKYSRSLDFPLEAYEVGM